MKYWGLAGIYFASAGSAPIEAGVSWHRLMAILNRLFRDKRV